jgi:hypothetical protein
MNRTSSLLLLALTTSCSIDVQRVDYAWTGAKCIMNDDDITPRHSEKEIYEHSQSGEWSQQSEYGRYWYARECCSIEGARFMGWETIPGGTSEVAPICLFGRGADRLSGAQALRERIRKERSSGVDRASGVVSE